MSGRLSGSAWQRVAVVVAGLVLASAACDRGGDPTVSGPRSSTTSTTAPTTTTSTTTSTTVAAPAQPASAGCPAVPARVAPRPDRSRYTLDVDVKPAENVVDGTLSVRFTPDLDTDRLVFRLWPNGPRPAAGGAHLTTADVSVDGVAAGTALPDPTTLVVTPRAPLAAGRTVTASLSWRLTLPGSINDRISRRGDAIRLGSFFPILSWEPGRGWATEPPTSGFAEASVAATADFTTRVTVPDGLQVLATGVVQGGRWVAESVSDFAVTVGRFRLASATAHAPHPVNVIVGVHETLDDVADRYLAKSVKVLEDFAARFGPYPWPAYSLALTPNLSGGIEYPMHVMQGPNTIGRTTSHEIGHMWFFGLVENNQGRDPWLDEGLATWAEYRFEGRDVTALSVPAAGRGRAGEPMSFWDSRQSIYYRSVYVQGAQALAALGPADRVDCALRHFVARHAYRVATPADFAAAAGVVFPDAAAVLARYGIRT